MNPPNFPQRVVILGGGTAGWMAAAYLDRNYNLPDRKRLPITLVEAPVIGRIGVGEATIPTLRKFCEFIGISETELMQRTNATLKQGVLFRNWNGDGEDYFHPFEALEMSSGINAGPAWLARKAKGTATPFEFEMGIQARLARANLSPKQLMDPDYVAAMPYAYHLDAEAFGDLLQEISIARGVAHIKGTVTSVEHHENGDVAAMLLADGRRVEGDLFIDCSGFATILSGGALNTPYVSYEKSLLCDRAIAARVPREDQDTAPIPPYTQAIALDAGWMWRIGLQTREGMGYVYSSKFIDDGAAEAEFRKAANLPEHIEVKRLKMRTGRLEMPWNKNVVALGLAGGFIEPLESTSIHMIELGLMMLVRYFPLSGINPAARHQFNERLNIMYDELTDFITAHYVASKRRDTPFWRAATDVSCITSSLQHYLNLWKDRHPSHEDLGNAPKLFSVSSWQAVLYGLDCVGGDAMANAAHWVPDPDANVQLLQTAGDRAVNAFPSHDIWIEGLQSLVTKPHRW